MRLFRSLPSIGGVAAATHIPLARLASDRPRLPRGLPVPVGGIAAWARQGLPLSTKETR